MNMLKGVRHLWRDAGNNSLDLASFIDGWNCWCDDCTRAMKSVFRKLIEDGVSTVVKHAPVYFHKKSCMLWPTGAIGMSSLLSLQCGLFSTTSVHRKSILFVGR